MTEGRETYRRIEYCACAGVREPRCMDHTLGEHVSRTGRFGCLRAPKRTENSLSVIRHIVSNAATWRSGTVSGLTARVESSLSGQVTVAVAQDRGGRLQATHGWLQRRARRLADRIALHQWAGYYGWVAS